MAAVKISFCLVLVALVCAEDVSLRSPRAAFIEQPQMLPKQTRTVVIDTNLAANDASVVANDIQQVYNSISGALNRAIAIQGKLNQRFPSVHNNAVVSFQAASYYQRYFLVVSVNGDAVLCFGL